MSVGINKKSGADAQSGAEWKNRLALCENADDGVAVAFVERADFAVNGFENGGSGRVDGDEEADRERDRDVRSERWPSHSWPV